MAFQEKSAWIVGIVLIMTWGWYALSVVGAGGPLDAAPWKSDLLWAAGIGVVAIIIGHIAAAIVDPAEAAASGDVRDREINRFAEAIGQYAIGSAAVGALLLAVFEFPYFWIANLLYLGLVVSELISCGVQIASYRYGLQQW